jgi:SAM-dependent MidA family methyltransferase
VGKQGDFITSVSIGSCFGMLLARRLHTFWKESGKNEGFHIVEPGAHDGSLCADILREIRQLDPDFFQATHYHLIEATPALITAQHQNLSTEFSGKFTSHTSLGEIHHLHGALLSNELIDAFPVELIRYENAQWKQMMVTSTDGKHLSLTSETIHSPELAQFCQSLQSYSSSFPEGYTTEYNPGIDAFSCDASRALKSGLFITIDYGHSAEDLYHPDRTTGTLQTYHNHQKSDNPLIAPGEIDITTHIDFTRLIASAETHGFRAPTLRTQASYLTDHARAWLLDIENPDTPTPSDTPRLLRQFQTLIHPAMLGTKFSVLEMKKEEMQKG